MKVIVPCGFFCGNADPAGAFFTDGLHGQVLRRGIAGLDDGNQGERSQYLLLRHVLIRHFAIDLVGQFLSLVNQIIDAEHDGGKQQTHHQDGEEFKTQFHGDTPNTVV